MQSLDSFIGGNSTNTLTLRLLREYQLESGVLFSYIVANVGDGGQLREKTVLSHGITSV